MKTSFSVEPCGDHWCVIMRTTLGAYRFGSRHATRTDAVERADWLRTQHALDEIEHLAGQIKDGPRFAILNEIRRLRQQRDADHTEWAAEVATTL